MAAGAGALTLVSAAFAQTVAPTPQLAPDGNTSAVAFDVTATVAPVNGVTPAIRYTLDGSDPNTASPSIVSGGKIQISRSLTLKARAFSTDPNVAPSAIKEQSYQVNGWVAARNLHSVALRTDGTLWAWGAQQAGRLGNGLATAGSVYLATRVLDPSSGPLSYIDVAVGANHTVALANTGRVWCFGENTYGQLGNFDQTNTDRAKPVAVVKSSTANDFLTNIRQVAAGGQFSLAVDSSISRAVWAWGREDNGRAGTGQTTAQTRVARAVLVNATGLQLSGIESVAAGTAFGVAAETKTTDGTGGVWAWGLNDMGQVGFSAAAQTGKAVPVLMSSGGSRLDNVVAISTSYSHVAVIRSSATENNTVWCWGEQTDGRLGNGQIASAAVKTPTRVALRSNTSLPLDNVVAVSAGGRHTLALRSDGTVWSWGANDINQLGRVTPQIIDRCYADQVILPLAAGERITEIAAGNDYNIVISNLGKVYAWGQNSDGQLGINSSVATKLDPTPVRGSYPNGSDVTGIFKDFIVVCDLDDSDNDGLKDWEEQQLGTNPLDGDSDDDGIKDGDEVNVYHTNPRSTDSDNDGMKDKWEIDHGLDPLRNDSGEDPDLDTRTNLQEYTANSDPHEYYNNLPPNFSLTGGDRQKGVRNTVLPVPFSVTVYQRLANGQNGVPLQNAPVVFESASGGSYSLSPNGANPASTLTTTTDANGKAQVYYILPDVVGKQVTPKVRAALASSYPLAYQVETYARLKPATITPYGGPAALVRVAQNGREVASTSPVTILPDDRVRSIHYTIDGADPTESDPILSLSGMFSLPAGTHAVKAKAFCKDYEASTVVTATLDLPQGAAGDAAASSTPMPTLIGQFPTAVSVNGSTGATSMGNGAPGSGVSLLSLRNSSTPISFDFPPSTPGSGPYWEGRPDGIRPWLTPDGPFTCFAIIRPRSSASVVINGQSTALSLGAEMVPNGYTVWTANNALGMTSWGGKHVTAVDQAMLAELTFDGMHVLTGCNGVWETATSIPSSRNVIDPVGLLYIGGSNLTIDRLVIYNGTLNYAQRKSVVTQLTTVAQYLPTDSDNDGVPDWKEAVLHTNPASADSDNDGLTDYEEIAVYGTNPNYFDTDGDLIPDSIEVKSPGYNPTVSNAAGDTDGDGLSNFDEMIYLTDPFNPDSDGDGFTDGEEVSVGAIPTDPTDSPRRQTLGAGVRALTAGGGLLPPAGAVSMDLTVGDPSSSNSERWAMEITRDSDGKQLLVYVCTDFGTVQSRTFSVFRAGESYTITLRHIATASGMTTDYDYAAGVTPATGVDAYVSDPQILLVANGGTSGSTTTNGTSGKKANVSVRNWVASISADKPIVKSDGTVDITLTAKPVRPKPLDQITWERSSDNGATWTSVTPSGSDGTKVTLSHSDSPARYLYRAWNGSGQKDWPTVSDYVTVAKIEFFYLETIGEDNPVEDLPQNVYLSVTTAFQGGVIVTPQEAAADLNVYVSFVQDINGYEEAKFIPDAEGHSTLFRTSNGQYVFDGQGAHSNTPVSSAGVIEAKGGDTPQISVKKAFALSMALRHKFKLYLVYSSDLDTGWVPVGNVTYSVNGACYSGTTWSGGATSESKIGAASSDQPVYSPTWDGVPSQTE